MLYHTQNPHGGDIYDGEILLDFSANTNPYGTPQAVLDAMSAVLPRVHQYPDPYCRELVKAISEFEFVPKDWILCGSGAAELIYSYCEALRPQHAMELAPTFSEYSMALARVGCRVERYLLKNDISPESLKIVAQIDNPEAIRSSVSRGLGVSIMSVLAAREYILSGRLLAFELGDQGAFRKIYLTWRKDALLTPAEEKFLEFVQSRPMICAPE